MKTAKWGTPCSNRNLRLMYSKVGDFRNSRGPPTVPLMLILRNAGFFQVFCPEVLGVAEFCLLEISNRISKQFWPNCARRPQNFQPDRIIMHLTLESRAAESERNLFVTLNDSVFNYVSLTSNIYYTVRGHSTTVVF